MIHGMIVTEYLCTCEDNTLLYFVYCSCGQWESSEYLNTEKEAQAAYGKHLIDWRYGSEKDFSAMLTNAGLPAWSIK
jgi:hypothetical protein